MIGTALVGQPSDGPDHPQGHRGVGEVPVGEVVGVEGARAARVDQRDEVVDPVALAGISQRSAGVVELDHRAVGADVGRLLLLAPSERGHLVVGHTGERPRARASGAVAAHDAREPTIHRPLALGDGCDGHDLEIVLVGADAQISGPYQRLVVGCAVGDVHVRRGATQFEHGRENPHRSSDPRRPVRYRTDTGPGPRAPSAAKPPVSKPSGPYWPRF
ncbi:MAG: hypothetical protein U5R31_11450 [Acidimicrobiia bacterium]|nr:hypothetical protein [Acidimicrobiia bacterium]